VAELAFTPPPRGREEEKEEEEDARTTVWFRHFVQRYHPLNRLAAAAAPITCAETFLSVTELGRQRRGDGGVTTRGSPLEVREHTERAASRKRGRRIKAPTEKREEAGPPNERARGTPVSSFPTVVAKVEVGLHRCQRHRRDHGERREGRKRTSRVEGETGRQ
jgi:hypothetical protein